MTTQETRQLMLDIAMNCHRIGNWIADDYEGKKKRIDTFIAQTTEYLNVLPKKSTSERLDTTTRSFIDVFEACKKDLTDPTVDKLELAERFMTWGNILTHRSKVL